MKPLHLTSISEQVAAHLREEILTGGLVGEMPGAKSLAARLGVNHKTVDAAALLLEKERLLHPQGPGKPRRIVVPSNAPTRALQVAILLYDPDDAKHHYMIDIRDRLVQSGHQAAFAPTTLSELKMDLSRIKRLTQRHPADAWIVQAASREVLEWFSQQPFHAFGLFGRFRNVPIASAGTSKEPAVVAALRELHELGHRKIVMIVQEEQILPHPGPIPRIFLDTLDELGIPSGRYNLPYWQMGADNFRQCLDSLFQHTPPTALFIPEAPMFIAALQHLAYKGIMAPDQVSMICHDPSPAFSWCCPEISHISFDLNPCIRRVLEWAKNVAANKEDKRQVLSKSVFVRGGTIGPPAKAISPRKK